MFIGVFFGAEGEREQVILLYPYSLNRSLPSSDKEFDVSPVDWVSAAENKYRHDSPDFANCPFLILSVIFKKNHDSINQFFFVKHFDESANFFNKMCKNCICIRYNEKFMRSTMPLIPILHE